MRTNIPISHFEVGDTLWSITSKGVEYHEGKLIINNLVVGNDNQSININGIASKEVEDSMTVNLHNINLTPGAIIPKAVGSSGLTPLSSGADFDVSQLVLSDLRDRIRHTMLADRLGLISDQRYMLMPVIPTFHAQLILMPSVLTKETGKQKSMALSHRKRIL